MSVRRYAGVGTAIWVTPDGRRVPYLKRRLLAPAGSVPTAGAHLVRLGERLDLIAAVTLGDAELSWMLADANAAMRPSQLAQPGAALLIPAGGSMAVSGAQ